MRLLRLTRREVRAGLAATAICAGLGAAVSIAHAGQTPAPPPRPALQIGGGILASPYGKDGYLVNMTIAPSVGDLTGPVLVTACNQAACHVVRGGGSLPIVNVRFSLGHPAAGAHVTVDVAACSRGYSCVRAQFSGVVPKS